MSAPAADPASKTAAAAKPSEPSGQWVPNINPATGLSTDYLNHFSEAVMVLEMADTAPECLDDLRAWRPKTYAEHFAGSFFRDRACIIGAYEAADPAVREALDRASDVLNAGLAQARDAILQGAAGPTANALIRRALEHLRPLLSEMAALINGTAIPAAGQQGPQAAIDAMFGR